MAGLELSGAADWAAAIRAEESLLGSAPLQRVFERTRQLLRAMHGANPGWGPLFARHRGDVRARRLVGVVSETQ